MKVDENATGGVSKKLMEEESGIRRMKFFGMPLIAKY